MIKPTSRKTIVSNTNNKEACDRHPQHRLGTYKCTLHDVEYKSTSGRKSWQF